MSERVDMVFKCVVMALLALLVLFYAEGRNVGRYQYTRDGDLEFVLDTATGVVYQSGYAMDHLTGKEGPVKR